MFLSKILFNNILAFKTFSKTNSIERIWLLMRFSMKTKTLSILIILSNKILVNINGEGKPKLGFLNGRIHD